MGNKTYQIVEFQVNKFREFTGQPRSNYQKIKKLVKFLKFLQNIRTILENFSDGGFFESYVAFLYLKVEHKKEWYLELGV